MKFSFEYALEEGNLLFLVCSFVVVVLRLYLPVSWCIGEHSEQRLDVDFPKNVVYSPSCLGSYLPDESEGAM